MREGTPEAATGRDRRADDDELGPVVARHVRHLPADPPHPRADEPAPRPEPVRVRDRGRMVEPLSQLADLGVEMGVERQFLLDEQWRNEDDAGAAVRREAAGKVECMLRLLLAEQRHDDAPVADGGRPPGQVAHPAPQRLEIETFHRRS